MPISAERVISITTGTTQILESLNEIRLILQNIRDDFYQLERYQEKSEKNLVNELIFSIKSSLERGINLRIDEQLIQQLYYEKAHFEVRAKHNNEMKRRMRAKRAREKEIEWEKNYNEENSISPPPTVRRNIEEVLREIDAEELAKQKEGIK